MKEKALRMYQEGAISEVQCATTILEEVLLEGNFIRNGDIKEMRVEDSRRLWHVDFKNHQINMKKEFRCKLGSVIVGVYEY